MPICSKAFSFRTGFAPFVPQPGTLPWTPLGAPTSDPIRLALPLSSCAPFAPLMSHRARRCILDCFSTFCHLYVPFVVTYFWRLYCFFFYFLNSWIPKYFTSTTPLLNITGGRHFCPKTMYGKLTKYPKFTWYLPEKFPNCRPTYDNYPKNIFPELFPSPPNCTNMLRKSEVPILCRTAR